MLGPLPHRSRRRRRPAVLLATLLLVLAPAVSACGDEETEQPPAQRLAAAKKHLDEAKGVRISLATKKLPTGVNGVLRAKGVGVRAAPAFKGDITIVTGGISATVPVVAIRRDVFVDFGGWNKIDPADFGAPNPASLFPRGGGGLGSLLDDVTKPTAGEDTRRGERVLSTITGTIPESSVTALIPQASGDAFDAEFVLTDDNVLQQAIVTGPFYPKSDDVSYTIDFTDYGATATIKPPKLAKKQ